MPNLVQRFRSWFSRSFAADFAAGRDLDDLPKQARMVSAFQQSAWVSSATNLVAGEIAGVPLKFMDGKKEFEDQKFADWWAAPAIGPNRQRIPIGDVSRALASWAKLEGEFFLLFDDEWYLATAGRKGAALNPFIIARPDRVRFIINGGELQGYEWIDAGGRRFTFVPEQVTHWKDFNPHDDWRGCGGLRPAKVAVESDFLAGVYIRDLMRNNGDQGNIVIGKNGIATPEQRDQITAALREKRAALRRGIARDIFLTGDIAVDRPDPKAADANLVQTRLANRHEVYIAFGVPPSMADIKASYSIGSASDRYQLITGTCMPLAGHIADAFSKAAAKMTGRAVTAEFDWDNHPVMQEVRAEKMKTAFELWNRGMSWKDINDYLRLGMQPFKGWEIPYLPFSVAPVGDAQQGGDPAALPDYAEPVDQGKADEDPDVASLRLMILARQRQRAPLITVQPQQHNDGFRAFACACDDCGATEAARIFQRARDQKEIGLWRQHMAKRREVYKSYVSRFNSELFKARAEVLAKIARAKTEQGKSAVVKVGAAADFIFDLDKWRKGLLAKMRRGGQVALKTAGDQLLKEVGKDDVFSMPPARVLDFLDERENLMSGVAQDVYGRINDTLQEGITDGDTMDELAMRIKGEFNEISRGRAQTVAQTETGIAYGVARHEAMEQAGVQYKAWLTSGNDNVRDSHIEAGRKYAPDQAIPLDEPFEVGGEDLQFPGDPNGSPGNVINCHCVQIAVAKPE